MNCKKFVSTIMIMTTLLTIQFGFNTKKVQASETWTTNNQVLSTALSDVNGDGKEEKIVLSSLYSLGKDITHIKGFNLSVINPSNNKTIATKEILKGKETYTIWGSNIFIGSIINTKEKDILASISMPTSYGTDFFYEPESRNLKYKH